VFRKEHAMTKHKVLAEERSDVELTADAWSVPLKYGRCVICHAERAADGEDGCPGRKAPVG
jgi:hypothetical protein